MSAVPFAERAARLLRLARENAKSIRNVGTARHGLVIVSAHRRDGHWTYDVGTDAQSHANGRAAAVLATLTGLLAEETTP